MLELMKALGYTEQTLMQKTRNIYKFNHFEMVIDQVENIGTFMEVELKTKVDDVKQGINLIYNFFKLIGLKRIKLQVRGYVSML